MIQCMNESTCRQELLLIFSNRHGEMKIIKWSHHHGHTQNQQ